MDLDTQRSLIRLRDEAFNTVRAYGPVEDLESLAEVVEENGEVTIRVLHALKSWTLETFSLRCRDGEMEHPSAYTLSLAGVISGCKRISLLMRVGSHGLFRDPINFRQKVH